MWSKMFSELGKITSRLDKLEENPRETYGNRRDRSPSESDNSVSNNSMQSEDSSDEDMELEVQETPIIGTSYILPSQTDVFPDTICLPNSSIKIGSSPEAMAVYYQKGGKPSIIIRRDCPEIRQFLEELSTFSSTKKEIPPAIRGPLNKNTEQFIGWNLKEGK